MNDRTLRTVVTGLSGLLVLVVAVTLLIIVGRSGSGTASPSAPPIAIASPTVTPPESDSPPPSAVPEESPTPTVATEPSPAASGSPGAIGPATLAFLRLPLDATDDPGGEPRIVTFRSDGAGTVTAKLATRSGQGKTHMCFLVGTKEIGCQDWSSGTFTGKTSQPHANWTVTLRGAAAEAPTVDLTVTFQAAAPSVTIEHARFDGTAAPEMNGINAQFTARSAGEVRIVAEWGGHPFLYQVDLFDERGGQATVSESAVSTEPSTKTDQAMPVTEGNWRILLRNADDGFGTTDLTATISWP